MLRFQDWRPDLSGSGLKQQHLGGFESLRAWIYGEAECFQGGYTKKTGIRRLTKNGRRRPYLSVDFKEDIPQLTRYLPTIG